MHRIFKFDTPFNIFTLSDRLILSVSTLFTRFVVSLPVVIIIIVLVFLFKNSLRGRVNYGRGW